MHALGFAHEFQRGDRDKYITFHPEKLPGGGRHDFYEYNFRSNKGDKLPKGVPFNFQSILQYAPSHLAEKEGDLVFTEVKPLAAGVPKPLGKFENMGQLCTISRGDRLMVDIFYQKECGLASVPDHKKGIKIEGTDCKLKFDPSVDDD